MLTTLLNLVFVLVSLVLVYRIVYYYGHGLMKAAILLIRYLAKKKAVKLNPKKEACIEPPKEAIASYIIEENKKRWLEKQAEAEAWLKEEDRRPYAKVLQFPRKL